MKKMALATIGSEAIFVSVASYALVCMVAMLLELSE